MRKAILCICGILWIMAMFQLIESIANENEDIVTAFNNEMYLSTESRVFVYDVCAANKMTIEAKKEMLADMAETLSIKNVSDILCDDTKTGEKVYFSAENESSSVTVAIEYNEETKKEYFMADIDIINSLESGVYYRELVEKYVRKNGMKAVVYLYLEGDIMGEMDDGQKKNMSEKILDNMSAEKVKSIEDAELYSVYGYSDSIEENIVIGGKRVNVNIVISYNESAGITEVYMATPIYNEDF